MWDRLETVRALTTSGSLQFDHIIQKQVRPGSKCPDLNRAAAQTSAQVSITDVRVHGMSLEGL
jgi:hypothetical protein